MRDFAADFIVNDLQTKLCSKEAWGTFLCLLTFKLQVHFSKNITFKTVNASSWTGFRQIVVPINYLWHSPRAQDIPSLSSIFINHQSNHFIHFVLFHLDSYLCSGLCVIRPGRKMTPYPNGHDLVLCCPILCGCFAALMHVSFLLLHVCLWD